MFLDSKEAYERIKILARKKSYTILGRNLLNVDNVHGLERAPNRRGKQI